MGVDTAGASHPGLSPEEAAERLARIGPNRLFTPAPVRFWSIAAEEITEPMILLLLVIGVLYGVWGQLRDALTIFVVILLLVLAEVGNEFRAKRAIAALERIAAPKARVRRAGTLVAVDTETVVPGDLLILAPGTRLAADARIAVGIHLSVDEAALTGESLPVEKSAGDQIHAGTVVMTGEGEAEAVATGSATRLGQIAGQLGTVKPPKTPLQLAMKSLAGKLVWVAVMFSVAIPLIGIARGGDWRQMVLTGLSLAFATVPEELPIIITMVLGLGAYRLSRRNFLIKRLRAAETLGDATVIVTDKTGTLTESRMQLAAVWPTEAERSVLAAALGTVSPEVPDALEQAVLERAGALGVAPPQGEVLRLRHPGDGRRSKAALRQAADALRLDLTGAPEEVFARCGEVPTAARERLESEAGRGRRCVAVASRMLRPQDRDRPQDDLERDLELAGLLSFADPPRAGVAPTLARLAGAGIRTLMVTGDHPATAAAVGREVGIPAERTLTGDDIDRLDDAALARTAREVSIYARATPQHKFRLVRALQADGEVVAVTGDGVNDALALRAADVGIAMGIKGTDVAREAAQAVLADDDYVTIAQGVFAGRTFFDNLRKGVNYYLSVKVALIAVFLLPVLLGLPLPFAPIQIILLELFMDLAASAAFVSEPAEAGVDSRRPRRTGAGLLDGPTVRDILFKGALLFATVMAAYAYGLRLGLGLAAVQAGAFTAWMAGHVLLAYVSRSAHEPALRRGLFANAVLDVWAIAALAFSIAAVYLPGVAAALHFAALPPAVFAVCAALPLLLVVAVEVRKSLGRR